MKYLFFLMLFAASTQASFAQVLITPFGGIQKNSDGDCLSFSTGEVAVETLYEQNQILTQGYQQPYTRPDESLEYGIKIYNGLLVDADSENAFFTIEGLENYPENKLYIVNRWGDLIYSSDGYANDWDGYYKGRPLPQATYYYVLELNEKLPALKGNLYILK